MPPLLSIAIIVLIPIAATQRDIRVIDITPAEFASRLANYVEIRRQVAAGFEMSYCADPEETARQVASLGEAIRDAVPLVESHFFTSAVAPVFRDRIAAAVRHGFERAAPVSIPAHETIDMEEGDLPWGTGRVLSPALVDTLPPLPPELEYRFVGRHLILFDVDVNLVVDVLRDALPDDLWPMFERGPCAVHPELPACWM